MSSTALPRANIARYASALREGGSLPGLVETDGGDMMVAKWRGAGQGVAALVAEIIVGELARAAGFNMPALAILELSSAIGRNERDQEIRDLLVASQGANLGMAFLEEALAFDPAAHVALAPRIAAKLVLFDSVVMNVDRTARNTNLLWWSDDLWLIDHGAALYWHHGWDGVVERPTRPFPLVGQHVLLPVADELRQRWWRLVVPKQLQWLYRYQ
ncbi:MAG: aminotransferase class I and II [Nannocystaceae bacterium]|nr:aminotransferase class I and II [Nannocystaceae bacterium]